MFGVLACFCYNSIKTQQVLFLRLYLLWVDGAGHNFIFVWKDSTNTIQEKEQDYAAE